jgi:hypothetical protein
MIAPFAFFKSIFPIGTEVNVRRIYGSTFMSAAAAGAALAFIVTTSGISYADNDKKDDIDRSVVQQGFDASPIPKEELNLKGKDPAMVGLGSYLVNTIGDCGGCHTFPRSLDPGAPGTNPTNPNAGNPFKDTSPDQSLTGQIVANFNKTHYLAGGRCFGPVMSRNITPDPTRGNLPLGLTEADFFKVMRLGEDVACELHPSDPICNLPEPNTPQRRLQTMPWPAFHSMTDNDLKAVYAYLSAIPHADACNTVDDGCPGFSGLAAHNPPNNTGYAFPASDTCPNHPLPPQ